jgi:DHA1 family multidrug resistance protein-like MFS transporter
VRLPGNDWQRNEWVTVAMVFVVFTGFAVAIPFLPLFVRELGVESDERAAFWGGLLISVAPLLAGLLAPVWGRLADRHGHKAIALKALGAYVVLLALTALVQDVWQLLALRIGVGLFGGIGPLGLAMATALAPRDETGHAVGRIQAAQILSAAVGPLCGGALADVIGFRRTFLVTSASCAVALVLVAWGYREAGRGPREETKDAASAGGFRTVLRQPGLVRILVALFLVNFVGRSFTPILALHLSQIGVSASRLASFTGLLVAVYAGAAALSAAGLGRASRKLSPVDLLPLSLVGGALAVLPMAFVPHFGGMLGLGLLLGLTSGGALTLCYTIGGLLVPAHVRTTAFGFFSMAALVGGAVAPSVAGFLAHVWLRAIYPVDAVLFLSLAVAVAWQRRRFRELLAAPDGAASG